MPRTSDKSERILAYVRQFTQENGFAPSIREIGAAVGLRSTASVSYHLQQLQEKGLLYPCYWTRSQLHIVNAPHLSDGT